MDIRYFDTLESTNNYCKLLDLKEVEEFTVIVAHSQTAGIGQQGNRWVSDPGKNLTFSIILKPSFLSAANQWQLTMMLAVAVRKSIESLLSKFKIQNSTLIKWPNDIYVEDQKICGILTTATVSNAHICSAICGIGLNVNQVVFPEWVPNPTSLALVTKKTFDLETVLLSLLSDIEKEYQTLRTSPAYIKEEYLNNMYRLGKTSKFEHCGVVFTGKITGIDHFGRLIVAIDDKGEKTFDLKEVKFVI